MKKGFIMKSIIFLLSMAFLLTACKNSTKTMGDSMTDTTDSSVETTTKDILAEGEESMTNTEPASATEALNEATPSEETSTDVTPSEAGESSTDTAPVSSAEASMDETYAEMLQRSLFRVGNNQRIKAAMDKAQRGEEVTLAYLGGSITQGFNASPIDANCYAALVTQIFADKYATDKEKIKYVNAGIAGTPSILGILRSKADIISKQPDIVFIEFAVNDGTDYTSCEIYESLVKRLLDSESSPAVVLIFTVLKNGYSAQDHMSKIGAYYDLGMISVKNAIFPEIEAGRMEFLKDYASDDAHPSNAGHGLIAEFIGNYFDKAAEKEADISYAMPEEAIYGTGYAALENITPSSDAILDNGDFIPTALSCFTYSEGWQKTTDSTNQPMIFKQSFGKLIISYKQVNTTNFGSAEVYIDDKLAVTLNGYASNGWGNIVTNNVYISNQAEEEHTVKIVMKEGDEAKTFILLGIGYVK